MACAESICNYLSDCEKNVMLLKDEIDILIESSYGFAKWFLSRQVVEIKAYPYSKD